MKRHLTVFRLATLAFAGWALIGAAEATVTAGPRAMPIHEPAGAVATAQAQHHFFGWVLGVNGSVLTIQLRNGRLLTVNAAQAVALKRVSAPIYHAKPVVVTGALGSGGTFYATAVTRAAPQVAAWGVDR